MMEYGGYLPLELAKGSEYHQVKEDYRKRLNSGRTVIYDILCHVRPKTVWVPHYICDTVMEAITRAGCSYQRYFLTDDFTIKNREDLLIKPDDCLILVNYFGLNEQAVRTLSEEYKDTTLILDQTQAFFAEPLLRERVYNVYSCRKFVGTADGAYLIATDIPEASYEIDYSSERSLFLLTSMERGTNYSYEDSKKNEEYLDHSLEMSLLTKTILQGADYSYIARRRRENYKILENALKPMNALHSILGEQVPYCYPLLLEKDIRKELLKEKLYIPVLWKELLNAEYEGTREWELSSNLLCVPLDQRYQTQDMTKIVEIIKKRVN